VHADAEKVGQSLSHLNFVIIVLQSVRIQQAPQTWHCLSFAKIRYITIGSKTCHNTIEPVSALNLAIEVGKF
jgi:hypothetical protein